MHPKNNLLNNKGWEWINDYVDADKDLVQMVHTYRTSTFKQYKYGVELPQSYKHALQLDERNGNKLWEAAINTEIDQMINEFKAFCIIKDGKFLSADYKKLQYHFVFDVKFDGRRKARWVMDGNFTPSMP